VTRRKGENYSAFFPLSGWGAKYRKVIEDYTKAFCQRRSRVYREVINDAIILALDAERTYDEAKGDPKTWLLQCLKGLGRRTQFLDVYGESFADGRIFKPPARTTKWGSEEPTGRDTRNSNWWEIETPQQWATKKRSSTRRAIIRLDWPRSELEEKLATAVKRIRPTLSVIEAGVLHWWLDCLRGKEGTLQQCANEFGMSGKGQASKILKRVLDKLKEDYQNLIE
jgi:hypothetical protein